MHKLKQFQEENCPTAAAYTAQWNIVVAFSEPEDVVEEQQQQPDILVVLVVWRRGAVRR